MPKQSKRGRSATAGRPSPGRKPNLESLLPMVKAGEAGLLGEVVKFIRTYVVMANAELVATALWVVHTYAVDVAEQTPYLAITSPEKQCGKTRLLETLELVVAKPWVAILPSEAVVYRQVEEATPTLLLDELDTVFNPRSADKHEGLRALINSGNRKGVKVPRMVGVTGMAEFSVYCPKALAGIGVFPDTITDRSLPVRLKRRSTDERVARFRRRDVEPDAAELRPAIALWVKEHKKSLAKARPKTPVALSDRMADACEPLLAIADRMEEAWQPLARNALVELCTEQRHDEVSSMRLRLLADLKEIFGGTERSRISTERLLKKLWDVEEAPWNSYYNRLLGARDLAALLAHYGIHSKNIKLKNGKVVKGYKRDDLQEAWERYAS